MSIRERALAGLQAALLGRLTESQARAGDLWTPVEPHRARLLEACAAVRTAVDSSNGPALGARDSSAEAAEAITALTSESGALMSEFNRRTADHEERFLQPRRSEVEAHAQALEAANLDTVAGTASTASTASFEACRSVDP